MPKIENEHFSFINEVLMPGEEGTLTLDILKQGNIETLTALSDGTLPVRISVFYVDRFGTSYTVEQEIRKIGKSFRMTEYLIKEPVTEK